jgi:AcrR family transcriptional regulator
VSIRTVAERAGCSHTLVGRHFGSKAGLEAAVVDRLTTGMRATVAQMCSEPGWPTSILLTVFRDHPETARLAVRCALGEIDGTPFVTGHNLGRCLAERVEERRGGDPRTPSASAIATAHHALSLVLGYISLEDLLIHGSRVTALDRGVRDRAITTAADAVIAHGSDPANDLTWSRTRRTGPTGVAVADTSRMTAREALLVAAVELYAERGAGSITTRDIADRADVNQGLIYHYFESREHLLETAVELANTPLVASSVTAGRLDLERLTRERPDLSSLVIMARHLVDGGRILDIRRTFTVFDAILARFDDIPDGAGPGDLNDPRLATMAASALYGATPIWDGLLRRMLKIPASADLEASRSRLIGALLDRTLA